MLKLSKELKERGWVETTLGEVCEITSSKRIFANEYQISGIPFFRGKEITEKFNGNDISTELFITEEKYNEIKNNFGVPKEDDILLTSVGTLGNPYLVKKDLKFYFKDGNLTWFRKYKNIIPKWFFYWIISSTGKEILSHAKIGSTQEAYTIASLKSLEIKLPPLSEQTAIANVLSSLDDKIEILREQNKILEEIGMNIYKEWFGRYNTEKPEELPEGWRVGKVGEELVIKQGKYVEAENLSEIQTEDKKYPIYGANGIRGYIDTYMYENPKVVFGCRGLCGNPRLSEKKSSITNTCMALENINSYLSSEFIYFLSKKIDFQAIISGSAQPQITVTNLTNIEIIVPNQKKMKDFDEIIKPIFQKISINNSQISSLQETRDYLLPKLIGGEINLMKE